MDEFYQAASALPSWLSKPLRELPLVLVMQIQEIRMREGCPVSFTVNGRSCSAERITELPPELRRMRFTAAQMDEILYCLCGGAVHSHQQELAQGYVTLPGGHRAGIAGQYLCHPQEGIVLQKPTSADLRIARMAETELPAALREALAGHFTGLLVAGEPGSGKTTLLRAAARWLMQSGKETAVIDERRELFPSGKCEGLALDVLSGLPKGTALLMALRTLAPRVVVLDELGDMQEVQALEQGFFGGVDLVASIHAANREEALRRPQVQYMLQHGMLRVLAVLHGRETPGKLQEVIRL